MAAVSPDRDVNIKLYSASTSGQLTPYAEFKALHWIGGADKDNDKVSPIIRSKIIPDLLQKSPII